MLGYPSSGSAEFLASATPLVASTLVADLKCQSRISTHEGHKDSIFRRVCKRNPEGGSSLLQLLTWRQLRHLGFRYTFHLEMLGNEWFSIRAFPSYTSTLAWRSSCHNRRTDCYAPSCIGCEASDALDSWPVLPAAAVVVNTGGVCPSSTTQVVEDVKPGRMSTTTSPWHYRRWTRSLRRSLDPISFLCWRQLTSTSSMLNAGRRRAFEAKKLSKSAFCASRRVQTITKFSFAHLRFPAPVLFFKFSTS